MKKPVLEEKGKAAAFYEDTHQLESWLLEQAGQRGYTETIEKIGAMLVQN
jgi:hypothetical protein